MIRIGITGGIGSGKSVVATLLRVFGVPIYVADEESRKLSDTSPVIREKLTALFGSDIYNERGLDRKLLAGYVFTDNKLLTQVNAIIHPEVHRHFLAWTREQQGTACAIESAILFESGFDKAVDTTLMVYAPREIRIERAARRDGTTHEEIIRRIESQMQDEEKRDLSDYVILNDGRHALLPQVGKFISSLRG